MRPTRFDTGDAVICTDPDWQPIGRKDGECFPFGHVYRVATSFKQSGRWHITLQGFSSYICYPRKHFIRAEPPLLMQLATIPQPQATPNRMSSREVAELTGKNHADVMRDIRTMAETLTKANMLSCVESASYIGGDGRPYPMYEMDKETTICLMTGYDAVARMKVIQRWQLLESASLTIPKTLSQALLLAAHQAEQVEQLQLQVAQQQEAVDFHEQVSESADTMPVGEAAKLLGVGPQKLFVFLRAQKILMNGTGGQHRNMPYQQYLDAKLFDVVERPYQTPDGKTHVNVKPVVTQKGLDYIRKRLSAPL